MKRIGNETKGNHIEDEKPSTQVGPRSDKACLGGQDDGASECRKLIDQGCETGLLASSARLGFRGLFVSTECFVKSSPFETARVKHHRDDGS